MRGLPSATALVVAFARAVTTDPTTGGPLDPIAPDLLPRGVSAFARRLGRDAARGGLGSRGVAAASLGLVDHLRFRTWAIDREIERAVAAGARQLVILGAGADARAHRMAALDAVPVFEVDHPATQALKQKKLGRRAGRTRFVAVDFERDDLAEELAGAGHDPALPTAWIWEGVTEYLTEAAVDATLAVVAARSATGSVVALTYGTPELASFGRVLHPIVAPAFAVLGEPLRGLMRPSDARRAIERVGLSVASDTDVEDWSRDAGARSPRLTIAERLLVAVK